MRVKADGSGDAEMVLNGKVTQNGRIELFERKAHMTVKSPRAFWIVVLALIVGLAGGVSVMAQQPGPQPAEQFYKNIQVLKGMPAHLMQPTMQLMEIALGVHCVYCHDADNTKREVDSKPQKAIARRMIQMVSDINRTQFAGREVVTCFTCHQGSTKPSTVLP